MKYHCYISAYEDVYSSDVEAATPAEHGQHGDWTVIPGESLTVRIMPRTSYEAAGPATAREPGT